MDDDFVARDIAVQCCSFSCRSADNVIGTGFVAAGCSGVASVTSGECGRGNGSGSTGECGRGNGAGSTVYSMESCDIICICSLVINICSTAVLLQHTHTDIEHSR